MNQQKIAKVRQKIDIIDHKIIKLLGKRNELTRSLAPFKQSTHTIRDRQREGQILSQNNKLADEYNVDKKFLAKVYYILFDNCVSEIKKQLDKDDL